MTAEPTVFIVDDDGRRPACLVLDMRMPGMGGLDLQDELHELNIDMPVIMLTGYGDVPSAVRALKSGVVDFVEKPFNNQEVLDKIQRSLETDTERQQERERHAEIRSRLERLTPREREVMKMVISGKSSKEIAHGLDISIKTVEVHRSHVMEKTQTANVAELLNLVQPFKN